MIVELPTAAIKATAITAVRIEKRENVLDTVIPPRVIVDFENGSYGNSVVCVFETDEERDLFAEKILAQWRNALSNTPIP